MHYRRNDFSRNGQNTIEPKPPYSNYLYTMGQSDHLSSQDISGMVQRYGGSGGGSPPNNNFANRQTLAGSGGLSKRQQCRRNQRSRRTQSCGLFALGIGVVFVDRSYRQQCHDRHDRQ